MKILMVCLGNICRSPLAEGILLTKIKERNLPWEVDSAGTSGWHQGELPDRRSIAVAKAHNIDLTYQRSRQFIKADFEQFDLILAMDSSNYSNILRLATTEMQKSKVKLILNYAYPNENRAVPDPYYEGGF
ncbi:MAG: low molecular weight protein-tyrosine-phosphatase, partial [Saprospiraceae bacterium]